MIAYPDFGRWVFAAMCVIAFVYAAAVLYAVRQSTYYYNGVVPGMSRSEVRYLYGPPAAADAAAPAWTYDQGGRQVQVRFGGDDRLAAITCSSGGDARFSCPAVMGVRAGSSEDALTRALGPPDRVTYGADAKRMAYDGMGVAFRLRRYLVEQIEVHQGASLFGYLPRALWVMVP